MVLPCYVSDMTEQNANLGPRYAIKLRQLKRYHILRASCPFCRHTATMRLWQLKSRFDESTSLVDIERRLRCLRCGERGEARLLVLVSEDD